MHSYGEDSTTRLELTRAILCGRETSRTSLRANLMKQQMTLISRSILAPEFGQPQKTMRLPLFNLPAVVGDDSVGIDLDEELVAD